MVTYAEHDSDDAEDDGEEARVVDGQVLGRQLRRRVRLRRRRLPRIAAPSERPSPRRRSLLHLSLSSVDSLDSGLREDEKERDFFLADEKKRD